MAEKQRGQKTIEYFLGTLQNLCINVTLSLTCIGSIICYKLEDINKLLEGGVK